MECAEFIISSMNAQQVVLGCPRLMHEWSNGQPVKVRMV